jgi:serine protease Do
MMHGPTVRLGIGGPAARGESGWSWRKAPRLTAARRLVALLAWMVLATGMSVPAAWTQELTGLEAAAAVQQALVDAIAAAEDSVVAIARVRRGQATDELAEAFPGAAPSATDPNFIPNEYATGVVIDAKGLILTNYHVLGDPEQNDYYVWSNRIPHKAAKVETALAGDPWMDLAVLKVDADNLKPIKFGDAKDLQKGQLVIALGNPFAIARDGQPSASWGIIANLSRRAAPMAAAADPTAGRDTLHHYGTLIQTDAKLNLGTSGGALINLRGEMIGLLTSLTAGPQYEPAAGFALPVDEHFQRTVDDLKEGRRADYGFLGVLPASLARDERVQGKRGAVIREVVTATPAHQAGLQRGDLILAVNNQPVFDDTDLIRFVSALPPEAQVELTVQRNQQLLTQRVVLSKKALPESRPAYSQQVDPEWRGLRVEYATAMPSFYQQSRLIDARGSVGVQHVERDSAAWHAGLRAGDYVSQVGRQRIRTPREFFDAVRRQAGDVSLTVYSGGRVATRVVGR